MSNRLLRSIVLAVATMSVTVPAATSWAQKGPEAASKEENAHKGKGRKGEEAAGTAGKPEGKGEEAAQKGGKPEGKGEEAAQKGGKGKGEEAAEKAGKPEAPGAQGKDKAAEAGEAGAAGEAAGAGGERIENARQKAKERKERRAERAKGKREKLRAKAKKVLKGQPMEQAFKQELERHARRMARLQRIVAVAAEVSDAETLERATRLVAKEQVRHDRWTAKYARQRGVELSDSDKHSMDNVAKPVEGAAEVDEMDDDEAAEAADKGEVK